MSGNWTTIGEWPAALLELEEDSGVARLSMNRPEKRNALSDALLEQLLSGMEVARKDDRARVVVTRGNGPSYCSGMDLYDLRAYNQRAPGDWDRPSALIQLAETLRNFPKVTIAQVHGYCLGGGLVLLNAHDLAVAATNARIGMPEIIRGSFGQVATSTLFHSGVPLKKASFIQLTGRNVSGAEADRIGLVSMAVEEAELEQATLEMAREVATRHPSALAHAKIASQMGRNLTLQDALRLDELVGARMSLVVDPLAHVETYLTSQGGGPNTEYKRPDV